MSEFLFQAPSSVRLIPAGHQGRMTAAGHETMPVRVFERGSDVLMLVVLLDADTGVQPERTEPVLLEYSSAQGLVRLHGEATLDQHDVIRFAPSEPAEVLQRREFVRIDSPQRVELTDGVGTPTATHAVDVSGGGMLLRGLDQLGEGDRVRFRLDLGPGELPLEGSARVVRVGEDGQRGVVFEEISSTDRQRLIHFIFDRQRIARAKTRDGARKRRRAG